ncbi:MAG: hypothetical protein U0V73_06315 [Acidimicrobiia bacterium]
MLARASTGHGRRAPRRVDLEGLAPLDPRVTLFRVDSEEFHQAATVNAQARTAVGVGAEWVDALHRSRSWRLTRPLRKLAGWRDE